MKELSLHILDLVENAIRAEAKRIEIFIIENSQRNLLEISIKDDGVGMDEKTKERVCDPFFSTKGKRVGMGIPLMVQLAEQCGGHLEIVSEEGKGTLVKAFFQRSHVDLPPLGNIPETLFVLLASHPEINFVFYHEVDGRSFGFESHKILEELGLKGFAEDGLFLVSLKDWIAYQESLLREGMHSENHKHRGSEADQGRGSEEIPSP